jgi:DNA-directed RNA polymerase beta subunit
MQQINPLDELTHKRRISAIGPGGLHRDRATAAVRDVHRTHYGRVCPLETPEGPSIGLIVSLACYGRINPYGFIETPYHKVEDAALGPVEYLTADSEDTAYIAAKGPSHAHQQTGNGKESGLELASTENTLPVRSGEDVLSLPMEKVDYIGVSPQQIVGISAALVPFLEHEDANRALMGANHQRQAVPLVRPEAPLVGTGMEAPAALYSGALITAKRSGTVTSVSADEILIHTGETLHHDKGENTFSEMGYDVYKLQTFKRSNSGTCIHQRPIVAVGDKVEAGQVIVDGTSTESGELALGRNVLCAYMPWGGHNYEDSILISETLIKEDTFTSIHIEEFEVEARETKVGPEEITRDIPNVSEQRLTQLDEEGIIRVGSVVGAGSILVGKITPKGESEYGPEEKLLRAIFGEKVKEVRDASTYVRPGVEGVVIDVKVFSRKPDTTSRRGSWAQGDSGLSMADNLRYESKRKEIEETSREQIASIRRRRIEEIRKTLIGCELADPLVAVSNGANKTKGKADAKPFANAGDTVTAEVLDAYISGFTADEYHLVTEDTNAEAFIAEAGYRVTDVPEPIPTIVVHPSDSSVGQEYLSEVCKPVLGSTEPFLQETEPVDAHLEDAHVVLQGSDNSVVAIVVYEDAQTDDMDEDEHPSERLMEMLAATEARFGVVVDGESEPDNWDFYELTDLMSDSSPTQDSEAQVADEPMLQPCARSEFEAGVTEEIEATGCPVVETQRLNEAEWAHFSQTYPGLQAELFWQIKEVFDPECPLTEGQELSDTDYLRISNDFPARPIAAGQRLTTDELAPLKQTAKDLKADSVWHITAVFDPACTLPVGEYVSDADYQQARKSCSLTFSDVHVTDTNAREHIQRVEEMAQGRITTYTEEKERALQQLEMGDELKPGVIKRVKVYVASKRPISVGDKMAGRYGNKGVVAKILPAEDMPYLPDGTPVELVLNPLGVPSRMNVGQILEIHLGWACHELGIQVESPVFDGATEGEIFEMLGKTELPERSKQTGKSILFDGRTGEPFAQEITVGYVYFLKLNHLVADKMHARSTGPYSLVTQQPLGGKAQHGGQRLGEMEVWALEAYGAAHTLQEMLTLKSDDVLGRREIYESVVKGLNPEPPGTPESFKVLVRELQTLGLHVSLDKDEDS